MESFAARVLFCGRQIRSRNKVIPGGSERGERTPRKRGCSKSDPKRVKIPRGLAMKLNLKMKEIVERNGLDPTFPTPLHPALKKLVEPGFVRLNDSILLQALTQGARAVSLTDFPDETGYESFVNHIHVEDYIPHEKQSASSLMANSMSLASTLCKMLRQSFPNEAFEVIVSFQDNHYTVRFHKCREGQQWLSDNLDDYQQEALMVVEA